MDEPSIMESLEALNNGIDCYGVLSPVLYHGGLMCPRVVWKVIDEYICKRNIPHMI
jgi:hypothetical protein